MTEELNRGAIDCARVLAAVPTFVDEEVPEGEAASIRSHLADCTDCRAAVQEETSLRQWFVPTDEVPVPDGFAARVARRAFAGDEGSATESLPTHTLTPVAAPADQGRLLSFTMGLTAAAAAVMMTFTLMLASGDSQGLGDGMGADSLLEDALDELEAEYDALEESSADGDDSAETDPARKDSEGAEPR